MSNFSYEVKSKLPELAVFERGQEDYELHTATWNILTQFKPKYIVQPTSGTEISKILKIAKTSGVNKINIRSGGHSFEGTSLGGENSDGLVIDVIKMNSITIDKNKKLAYVESGALLGQFIKENWDNGRLMTPTGICVTVGVGGQATCGGYGMFAKKYGIMADQVREFEIVTANGDILTANKSKNSDLFWAVLGSGTGSYGIITRFTFQLYDAPRYTAKFTYDYNLDSVNFKKIFKKMQDFTLGSSIDITTMIVIWLGELEITGTIATDSEEEFTKLIKLVNKTFSDADKKEMLEMNYLNLVMNIVLTQTSAPWYKELHNLKREGNEYLRFMKIKAGYIPKKLPDAFITELEKVSRSQKTTSARIQILSLNPNESPEQALISIKERKCPLLMGMSVWVESKGLELHQVAETTKIGVDRLTWLNEAYEVFYPYTSGGYIGDDDIDEWSHGRDLYQSYYGDNLGRLIEIKKKYDPDNIFNSPMSIPTQVPGSDSKTSRVSVYQ